MKKIFTSLMLLGAALTAGAQNFHVTGLDDATYTDGDEITVGYRVNAKGSYFWNPELVVHVEKAASSLTGKSNFTITATADVPYKVQFCGVDGSCVMLPSDGTSKTATYAKGDIIPLEIDIASTKTMLSQPVKVELKITDGVQTQNYTLNFVPEQQAGISAPEVAAAAVKVTGRVLHYNVAAAENLTLYNISGRAVLSRSVNGNGTISLSGLPAGVYVYRLGHEAGKLLVK